MAADDSFDMRIAGEMYTGSYHLAARRAAHALTGGGRTGRVLVPSYAGTDMSYERRSSCPLQ
ncbi:hypothetical protein [Streptomyces sp. SBT349]|uniref:hypothetical protein n=1 Tax=Streptomyces sp. SBT349 TaxID=1580539 RepID=UPI00066ED0DD|nr:hypothetical protein [Streptomyces sp. SBT349]